jgi:hypothetical protein
MPRRRPLPLVAAIAAIVAAAVAGCTTLLGGEYTVVPPEEDAAPPDEGGAKPSPEAGVDAEAGADGCVTDPQNKSQFENACGSAMCAPFDNAARNTRCADGGTVCPRLPPLADAGDSGVAHETGTADASDASVTQPEAGEAGDDGGSAAEAGPDEAGSPDDADISDATLGDDGTDPDAAASSADDAAAVGAEGGADASANVSADAGADASADAAPPLPSCFSLTHGPAGGAFPAPIIYATGSTAIQPYVARVAQVLESLQIASVVYLGAGSCLGVNAMIDPSNYPLRAIGKTASYYDSVLDKAGNVQSGTCAIDDPSRVADVGISDVFPTTCDPQFASQGGLPNNLHDFFGPVQVMEMVVPKSSMQTSISAEAAYMVWGYGNLSGVAPWTDESFLLQRSATSGTQNMIAATIGLPAAQWRGMKNSTSTAMLAAIENVGSNRALDGGPSSDPKGAEKTIGILASDVADANRQYVKPLAFQDVGEPCGWYPDSTQDAFDKKNVRDGHYPIWGPSHLIVYADANGNASNAGAKTLVEAMNGTNAQVLSTLDVVQFYARSHIIPTCAMHVTRTSDGHDYQPYAPPTSCSCYYDLQATNKTSCVRCSTDADCKAAPGGATTCVNIFGIPPVGYCEAAGTGQRLRGKRCEPRRSDDPAESAPRWQPG